MSWDTVQLQDLCSPKQHKTIATKNLLDSGYPVFGANGQIGFHSSYTHAEPTIAITCRGATCGTVNVTPQNCYINGNAMALDNLDKSKADLYYLKYFFKDRGFHDVISGSAQPQITRAPLLTIKIPLPPLPEQKRIAAILDQADALRRQRQRALDHLNQLGQSIFYEMFGDPVENPKEFERKQLNEIINFIGGSQPAKTHFRYEDGPDLVRFVQTRDFRTDKYKTYVPRELAKRPFNSDDVIIGRYGPPVFQIFRGLSGTYNVALMKAEPRDGILKEFVFHLLQEKKLHGYVVSNSERTAGQSGVNLDLLKSFQAYKPPISLQEEFLERMKKLKSVVAKAENSLAESRTLFASLQQRAFRGEL